MTNEIHLADQAESDAIGNAVARWLVEAEPEQCGAQYEEDPLLDVACDLPQGHDGPHEYTICWED